MVDPPFSELWTVAKVEEDSDDDDAVIPVGSKDDKFELLPSAASLFCWRKEVADILGSVVYGKW